MSDLSIVLPLGQLAIVSDGEANSDTEALRIKCCVTPKKRNSASVREALRARAHASVWGLITLCVLVLKVAKLIVVGLLPADENKAREML